MEFNSSARHTVGVEWELQLLDPDSLDLSDGIVPLMEFFPDAVFVKPEFIQSCVELNSCIAATSGEAVEHLRRSLHKLLQRCSELEMSVCGAGTHPFCRRLALITPMPRYANIEKTSGYLAHTQITFSTHVHVGMTSGDQAIQVLSRLAPAIPAFVALAANSPFWRGHETGHACYRLRILAAAPNYGLPPRFDDWLQFQAFLEAARRASMIETIKDVHWDIRPHPDFGTLELRAMDAASDLYVLHGLVAFARCLMLSLAEAAPHEVEELLPSRLPYWIENQNRFRAGLRGLDAEYVVDETGRHRPLRELVADLIAFCRPLAAQIGEQEGLEIAAGLATHTPVYRRQIDAYRKANSARSVVKMLQQSLVSVP